MHTELQTLLQGQGDKNLLIPLPGGCHPNALIPPRARARGQGPGDLPLPVKTRGSGPVTSGCQHLTTPSRAHEARSAFQGCSVQVRLPSEQLATSCRFLTFSSLTGLVGAWGPCVQDHSCKGRRERESGPRFPRAAGLCGSCLSCQAPQSRFFPPAWPTILLTGHSLAY